MFPSPEALHLHQVRECVGSESDRVDRLGSKVDVHPEGFGSFRLLEIIREA